MWDPFRYKLGGRLLNGEKAAHSHLCGQDDGKYPQPGPGDLRDLQRSRSWTWLTERRRFLSFEHIGNDALVDAFGPVIDRHR